MPSVVDKRVGQLLAEAVRVAGHNATAEVARLASVQGLTPRDFDSAGGAEALIAIALTADPRVQLKVDATGFVAWMDVVDVAHRVLFREQKLETARRATSTEK
jgi:hypothetical protein